MAPRPGEIYWAYTGEDTPRPVVIVSREELNRGGYLVGLEFTSARVKERSTLPNCVPFRAGQFGLSKPCVAKGESITYLHESELDLESGVIGVLDADAIRAVVRAIGYVISAECEPV